MLIKISTLALQVRFKHCLSTDREGDSLKGELCSVLRCVLNAATLKPTEARIWPCKSW